MVLEHTFTAVHHSTGSHFFQSHTCRRGDRQVRQRSRAGVRCYVSSLRPIQPSAHTVSYPPLFPLRPTVLIIRPFSGTGCAIKRFLNEDEALRSKLFEWFLWMTQGLVASWEEDLTQRRSSYVESSAGCSATFHWLSIKTLITKRGKYMKRRKSS